VEGTGEGGTVGKETGAGITAMELVDGGSKNAGFNRSMHTVSRRPLISWTKFLEALESTL